MPILLGIVLYAVVEIAAVVAVASWLGIGWTLLLLLGLSLLGLVLLRREGSRAWRSFQLAVADGRPPGREVPITFTEREVGRSKMSRAIVVEALWRVAGWGLTSRSRSARARALAARH